MALEPDRAAFVKLTVQDLIAQSSDPEEAANFVIETVARMFPDAVKDYGLGVAEADESEAARFQALLGVGALWMVLSADDRVTANPVEGSMLKVQMPGLPNGDEWDYLLHVSCEPRRF